MSWRDPGRERDPMADFLELRNWAIVHRPHIWASVAGMEFAAGLRKLGKRYGVAVPPDAKVTDTCRAIRQAMERDVN